MLAVDEWQQTGYPIIFKRAAMEKFQRQLSAYHNGKQNVPSRAQISQFNSLNVVVDVDLSLLNSRWTQYCTTKIKEYKAFFCLTNLRQIIYTTKAILWKSSIFTNTKVTTATLAWLHAAIGCVWLLGVVWQFFSNQTSESSNNPRVTQKNYLWTDCSPTKAV